MRGVAPRRQKLACRPDEMRQAASESVRDVRYLRFVAPEYPDHVEADFLEVWLSLGEVLFGDEAEFVLFEDRHGFDGLAEGNATAEFHLAEDEGSSVVEDQIYLPVAGLEVALDEGVAEASEVAKRDPLPALSVGAAAFQLPTPA